MSAFQIIAVWAFIGWGGILFTVWLEQRRHVTLGAFVSFALLGALLGPIMALVYFIVACAEPSGILAKVVWRRKEP